MGRMGRIFFLGSVKQSVGLAFSNRKVILDSERATYESKTDL